MLSKMQHFKEILGYGLGMATGGWPRGVRANPLKTRAGLYSRQAAYRAAEASRLSLPVTIPFAKKARGPERFAAHG